MDAEALNAIANICERLQERRVGLFLGAGVNFGLFNEAGIAIPLGQALSDMIARDVLHMDVTGRPLDSISEMARYQIGPSHLNSYLHKLLKSFSHGPQHLTIAQLPWNVIYTTNYDTLLEEAAANRAITPAGKIRPIVSINDLGDDLSEEDIPYFKLHGCIDLANSDHGRLILTKDDYRFYETHRKPLFKRLREELIQQTLVFVGYGLEDANFRAILEDCRNELGVETFPQSYAIRVGVSDPEKEFWKQKYNITHLNMDGRDFLNLLRGTWNAQNCAVIPFALRYTQEYTKFDDNTSFQKVGESFYQVRAADCVSAARPSEFFRGGEPGWGDIRERVAPMRDTGFAVLDAMTEEIIDAELKGGVYVITGAAGTGKTTLVRQLAFEIASSSFPVLIHIPGTPINEYSIRSLISSDDPKRVVIFIEHASERVAEIERLIKDIRTKKLPVSIVLSDRKNLWEFATQRLRQNLTYAEFEVARLSSGEVERILTALTEHESLGMLTGASREYQIEHFEQVAHKELIVALRELTANGEFDRIILDEYHKIPAETGKDAYRYVAALGQIDQPVRLEVLARIMEIGPEEIQAKVLAATEGILLTGEDFGSSRHNAGYRVQTRHPIIASVIFAAAASDDQAKFDVINSLLDHLNVSFPEDHRVLTNIVRRKELVNTIASQELKRGIYDRLSHVLPGDPYVLQHRSLLERELGNPDAAIKYARLALQQQPTNQVFKNTLGTAYEAKARTAEPLERDGLLKEATSIFEAAIATNSSDPYGYIGLTQVMKQKERNETDRERKLKLRLSNLSMLEDAFEATSQAHIIAGPLASLRETMGDQKEAIDLLKSELTRQPQDMRLRDLLARMLHSSGKSEEALRVAEEGPKYNAAAWRMQRQIARLQRHLGKPTAAIIGHYDAAFRHNRADPSLIAEYGAFLFMDGRYPDAEAVFTQGRNLPGSDKKMQREVWKNANGGDRIFNGIVQNITAAVGQVMAIPENFTVKYWRTYDFVINLKERDRVSFMVGFSAIGAHAISIRRIR